MIAISSIFLFVQSGADLIKKNELTDWSAIPETSLKIRSFRPFFEFYGRNFDRYVLILIVEKGS